MASIPKTQTSNKVLFDTVNDLRKLSNKTGSNVWKAVAAKLASNASQRPEVNVSKIEKFATEGSVVIVPGKVLGDGIISKKVTVVGFKASSAAIGKIEKAGGKFIELKEYIAKAPKDKVVILG